MRNGIADGIVSGPQTLHSKGSRVDAYRDLARQVLKLKKVHTEDDKGLAGVTDKDEDYLKRVTDDLETEISKLDSQQEGRLKELINGHFDGEIVEV